MKDQVTLDRVGVLPIYGSYRIPFMTYINDSGVPDFRILDQPRIARCAKEALCGICGQKIEDMFVFVGGIATLEHRHYIDPPYHWGCVDFAFEVCPYLLGSRDYADPRPNMPTDVIQGNNPEELRGVQMMALVHSRSYRVHLIDRMIVFTPGDAKMITYRSRKPGGQP